MAAELGSEAARAEVRALPAAASGQRHGATQAVKREWVIGLPASTCDAEVPRARAFGAGGNPDEVIPARRSAQHRWVASSGR